MKTLKVVSLKQNKIKNKYVKVENRKNVLLSASMIVIIFLCCFALNLSDNTTNFSHTFNQVYNPVNPLYNSLGDVVFTGSNANINLENRHLKFIVPIRCANISTENGNINFVIDSNIMIMSPEDGVISQIGVLLNGEKFIEIMHSNQVVSRFENIDLTGVIINEAVKKGKEVATAKVGETVRFSVFSNSIKQTNLTINKNQIIWEN